MHYDIHTRSEIIQEIRFLTDEYNTLLASISNEAFRDKIPGKWSIGENIEHLINTNTITALALAMPKTALEFAFGKHSGASRSTKEIVRLYQRKTAAGAGSPAIYVPKVPFLSKDILTNGFNKSVDIIEQISGLWPDDELDRYLFPHPILGKITGRELLSFTAYHLYHHLNTVKALAIYANV